MRAGPQLGKNLNPSWRKRQPYGSTMTIQVWSRHSPFKVVADAFILTTINFVYICILSLAS